MTKDGLGETRAGDTQLPRPGQWGQRWICSCWKAPPPAGWARVHSYTLKYAECKQCPLHPSSCRGVTTLVQRRPMGSVTTLSTNGSVSPGSRPMGSVAVSRCPRAADQWEAAAASLVQHTRPASSQHQPPPDMEKHGDKQANWFRPPRAKLNKYHFLLLFNLIT